MGLYGRAGCKLQCNLPSMANLYVRKFPPRAIIKVQCCNNKVFNEVSLFKFPYIIYYVTCFVILYSVFVIYSFWSHRHFVWYFQRSWHCLSPESESAKKFTNCPAPPVRETLPKAKRTRGFSNLDNFTT